MTGKYILNDDHTFTEVDLMTWATAFEGRRDGDHDHWRVARDVIDGVVVSTVFMGLDHQFGEGPPILFETMIFGGTLDDYQERYATWEQAEAGHKRAIELVKGGTA